MLPFRTVSIEEGLAFLDLLGMTKRMHGDHEKVFIAVHGTHQRIRRDLASQVPVAGLDKPSGALVSSEEMPKRRMERGVPSGGIRDFRGRDASGAVEAARQNGIFPVFVHHRRFRRLSRHGLRKHAILGDGQVFDALDDRPFARGQRMRGNLFGNSLSGILNSSAPIVEQFEEGRFVFGVYETDPIFYRRARPLTP